MSIEPSPKIRATIVKVPDASPGLLFLNGQQRPFTLEGVWRSAVAPAANMTLDVELNGAGAITSVTVVDAKQLAQERLNQIGGVAQERGKEAAKLAQEGIGALAARMGKVALAAVVVIWIAWFFIPGAKIDMGFAGVKSFTFWEFLGFDLSDPSAFFMGAVNHGFFSFLGLVAIAAPFAAPFIRDPRAKYLNVLPLVYIVMGIFGVRWNIARAAGPAQSEILNAISITMGTYVMIAAGLALAAKALKRTATA